MNYPYLCGWHQRTIEDAVAKMRSIALRVKDEALAKELRDIADAAHGAINEGERAASTNVGAR